MYFLTGFAILSDEQKITNLQSQGSNFLFTFATGLEIIGMKSPPKGALIEMSTTFSKQGIRQGIFNPDLALVFAILLGILAISGSFTRSVSLFLPEPPRSMDRHIPDSSSLTFTSDEKYWEANCSHGWNSDPLCDAIVVRTKVCASSISSAYCSDYENYLRQFYDRKSTKTAYLSEIK
jgi:hypothetical protein